MVAIKSPSFEEDAVCSHICEWMSQKDIIHRRIGNNIVDEHITDAEKPVLMLCAHIDTVSPSPDYSFDPYNPDYEKAASYMWEFIQFDDSINGSMRSTIVLELQLEDIFSDMNSYILAKTFQQDQKDPAFLYPFRELQQKQ